MSTMTEGGRATATQMIERMKDPRLPEEELRRTMKTFLVSYANHIFVKLPEKKQKAAALMSYAAIDANPMILRCDPASIIKSVAEAALYELTIGGPQAQCYLVPYGKDCKLQISYKGLIELCRRAGDVNILVEDVRQGDHFDCTFGDNARIEHKPAFDSDRGKRPITHVYAIIKSKDGGVVRRVFSASEIDANKEKYSKAWQRAEAYVKECLRTKQPINDQKLSPWHASWLPMAKKTVLKSLINGGLVPMSMEARDIVAQDDEASTVVDVAPPQAPLLSDVLVSIPEAQDEPQPDPVIEKQPEPAVEIKPQLLTGDEQLKAFVERLELTDMVKDAESLYQECGNPDKCVWTPEQDAMAKQLMEAHCNAIRAKRGAKKS